MNRIMLYVTRECGVDIDPRTEQGTELSQLNHSHARLGVLIVIQGRRDQEAMCGGLREVGD
jgi:hypothetical protein